MTGTVAAPLAVRPAGRFGVAGWCLFDWAMSAYNTVIGTFVFSVYFAASVWGDPTEGSAVWAFWLGISGAAAAILSPVLGAVADRGGRVKPWLGVFVLLTIVPTAGLFAVEPDPAFVVLAIVLILVSATAFELSSVFYNAMLSVVATPDRLGRVSGWGWGVGYFGGLLCLVVALVLFVRPPEPLFGLLSREGDAHIRGTALLVAVWFGLFALPLFLFSPDRRPSGRPLGRAVRDSLKQLWHTLKAVRRQGNIVRFLIASAFYRDGINTITAVGGLYAAVTIGLDFEQLILFAIGLNVTAGLGAVGFGWVDDRIGPRATILIALVGLMVTGVPLLLVDSPVPFIALALALGIFFGPAQAAGRSMMSRLSPDELEVEFFGLYALIGRAASILGLLLFAGLTTWSGSQRIGLTSVLALFVAGFVVMLFVRDPTRQEPR